MQHIDPAQALVRLLKFVAVAVVAVAVGVGVGVGLSKARGNEVDVDAYYAGITGASSAVTTGTTTGTETGTTPATTSAPATTGTTTPATTSTAAQPGTSTTELALDDDLVLTINSAELIPATKPAGKARNRARLAVEVTVTNNGSAAVTAPIEKLALRIGDGVVRPDVRATDDAGPVLEEIAPGAKASGQLHFETAGSVTSALKDVKDVPLFFGPESVRVAVG